MKILIVSPHPDDAELGIGGTIVKLKQQKHKVFIIDLTSGEPTPYGSRQRRRKEAKAASGVLEIDARINLGLQNRYLSDNREARLLLAQQIRLIKPDILFCPYPQDAHPDHIAAAKITEAARFYAKFTKVKLKGQPHYPFYLFYFFCTHLRVVSQFSFLVDISGQFSTKIKAVSCYRSQFIENPKAAGVIDYIKAQNKFLGELVRVEFAEAVYSKEAIKVDDLSHFL